MATEATKTITNEGTALEGIRHDHDCFGKIQVSKVQATDVSLFGSALKHHSYIEVEISRAYLERRNNRDRISDTGEDSIVRFAVSESQWAKIVSSIGSGTGTPVTLRRAPARGTALLGMPMLKQDPVKKTFEAELRAAGEEVAKKVKEAQSLIKEFLKPGAKAPSKKQLEALDSILLRAGSQLGSNLGYIQETFAETMEKTVEDAKIEIEAFAEGVAKQAGWAALANNDAPITLGLAHKSIDLDGEVN